MPKFKWENGTKIADANVEINGNIFNVNPAQHEGKTPLSAQNLNAMQDGIYEDMITEKEILDTDLEEYTQKEGYLVNEENKELINPKIPRYEEKGEVVELITFDNANFTTKTVEDLNNFKLLIWQCCYKGQPQRVLGSIIGTVSQMKQCDKSGLTWQISFPGNVNEFMCELYYKSDTELISRVTGQYAMGVLYGIRK